METVGARAHERAKHVVEKAVRTPKVIGEEAKRLIDLTEHVKKLHERVERLERVVADLKGEKDHR